jgi:hypothetical protein
VSPLFDGEVGSNLDSESLRDSFGRYFWPLSLTIFKFVTVRSSPSRALSLFLGVFLHTVHLGVGNRAGDRYCMAAVFAEVDAVTFDLPGATLLRR